MFTTAIDPIIKLIDSFLGPIIAIVAAVGVIYCVFLGVRFAKADEPQEKEKAKNSLKSAIIGFLLIFILIVGLKLLTPILVTWAETQSKVKIKP